MVNSDFAFNPWLVASKAIDAARVISSYDELVHEPINPTSNFSGQPFSFTAAANFEIGHARSGVNGPLMCGSNSDKLISITWSKYFSGFAYTSLSPVK